MENKFFKIISFIKNKLFIKDKELKNTMVFQEIHDIIKDETFKYTYYFSRDNYDLKV